jgi:nucleotidyltransferase/DNA polymerase involved in DNA repair
MTLATTCKRCRQPIVAADEDELVAQVQAHARDHGGAHGTHVPTRDHILAHIHEQATQGEPPPHTPG